MGCAVRYGTEVAGVTLGGMTEPDGSTRRSLLLAEIHGYGAAYRRYAHQATRAHAQLVATIERAYAEGFTVAELAAASGLSRPAVYRAVKPPPRR